MLLHAGWRVEDQTYGAPFGGHLPLPAPLLRWAARQAVALLSRRGPFEPGS
jgi:hypothetical protein